MSLWLPSSAQRDQRAAEAASLARAVAEVSGHLDYWNKKLRELDPHLQLVKAPESATHPRLRPGYFHVLRTPPDGVASVFVVEGPDGELREPDSGLLRELEKGDMWNDRALRAREEERKQAEAERERKEQREAEERRTELKDRLKSRFGTSISLAGVRK